MRPFTTDPEVHREIWLRQDYRLGRLARGKVVADVGAHIGLFTAYALLHLDAREVRAFEPDPRNFDLLLRNLTANGLRGKVAATRAGLLPRNPELEKRYPSVYRVLGLTPTGESQPLMPILEPEALYGCEVIKMDIEGGELAVVSALPEDRLREVETLVMEYHLRQYGREGLAIMVSKLQGAGFTCRDWPHRDPRYGILRATRSQGGD